METRDRLLDAAETVCRQRGYEGFSYADLSAVVGIRKASIHYHFATKADLAAALIERYKDVVLRRLKEISEDDLTAGQQLGAYIDIYREALQDGEQVCLCVALASDRDSLSESVLSQLHHFHDMSRDWLKSVFQAGRTDGSISAVTDADAEAAACLGLMEGAQLLARSSKDITVFELATAALRARLSTT